MGAAPQLAQGRAVEPLGDGRYQVACAGSCGGAGAHVVTIGAAAANCDCPANALGHRTCRHLKAVLDYLVLAPLEATKLANALASSAGPGLERDVPPPDDQPDGAA